MSRSLLTDAAAEATAAGEAATDPDARDRLAALADQLRSQANRETTPALGALDRIQLKLREIERRTDEPTVAEAIDRAREDVLSFLETLDDRGMNQHGGRRNEEANGPV